MQEPTVTTQEMCHSGQSCRSYFLKFPRFGAKPCWALLVPVILAPILRAIAIYVVSQGWSARWRHANIACQNDKLPGRAYLSRRVVKREARVPAFCRTGVSKGEK